MLYICWLTLGLLLAALFTAAYYRSTRVRTFVDATYLVIRTICSLIGIMMHARYKKIKAKFFTYKPVDVAEPHNKPASGVVMRRAKPPGTQDSGYSVSPSR
jgi:hypothetical protein